MLGPKWKATLSGFSASLRLETQSYGGTVELEAFERASLDLGIGFAATWGLGFGFGRAFGARKHTEKMAASGRGPRTSTSHGPDSRMGWSNSRDGGLPTSRMTGQKESPSTLFSTLPILAPIRAHRRAERKMRLIPPA